MLSDCNLRQNNSVMMQSNSKLFTVSSVMSVDKKKTCEFMGGGMKLG